MKHLDPQKHPWLVRIAHYGHVVAHICYLGLVAVESHGLYGVAAAALLGCVFLHMALGLGGD
ncbi:hypothetical protein [Azospirillum sp. sgz301742]